MHPLAGEFFGFIALPLLDGIAENIAVSYASQPDNTCGCSVPLATPLKPLPPEIRRNHAKEETLPIVLICVTLVTQ